MYAQGESLVRGDKGSFWDFVGGVEEDIFCLIFFVSELDVVNSE